MKYDFEYWESAYFGGWLGKAIVAAVEEIEELQAFARIVMECWPMGDLDGGALQDAAEKHGLLKPETRNAPCTPDGEGCNCAEYASTEEFEHDRQRIKRPRKLV